jgi:tetratricopeptide (TPR) repeat protein
MKLKWLLKFTGVLLAVLLIGYFLGIVFWPWAWEDPLSHPLESLALIKDYPTTVRQIFEGELYWSDQFPWYYLFKYLFITLPLVSLLGFIGFLIFRPGEGRILVKSIFLLIAFGFPLFYAAVTGANVYGGWRQMLFVFPPFTVISAIGIWNLWLRVRSKKIWITIATIILVISMIYPVYFSIVHYPYQYTFFNVLQGGFKGAYGKYELDYYFTSFKEAYQFIDEKLPRTPGIVAANFIIPEYYKDKPYKSRLINYYDRSIANWDYAIICNTFLNPYQIQNEIWPPENTIFQIDIEGEPILAILERKSTSDLEGIKFLKAKKYESSIQKLNEALSLDPNNESILINLARSYSMLRNYSEMIIVLNQLLEIYPQNEWAMDLKGEMYLDLKEYDSAEEIFKLNIEHNYKFFHSYVNLAKTYLEVGKEDQAIQSLKKCLRLNPFYRPAYQVYGNILIDRGEVDLGKKMLNYKIEGDSKYGMD